MTYKEELMQKLNPLFDSMRKENANKSKNDIEIAELFIIGMTAMVDVISDIKRIADAQERKSGANT